MHEISGSDLVLVLGWAKPWDIPLNAGESSLFSRKAEGITMEHEDDLFTRNATNNAKDLWIQVISDFKRDDQCVAVAAIAGVSILDGYQRCCSKV